MFWGLHYIPFLLGGAVVCQLVGITILTLPLNPVRSVYLSRIWIYLSLYLHLSRLFLLSFQQSVSVFLFVYLSYFISIYVALKLSTRLSLSVSLFFSTLLNLQTKQSRQWLPSDGTKISCAARSNAPNWPIHPIVIYKYSAKVYILIGFLCIE